MQKGDPMELNFEGLEMWKWNIPTDRAQRVHEKNLPKLWLIFAVVSKKYKK